MNYNDPLIITVGQLNRYVKSLLDADENLYNLYLVGEISNFTDHYKSGHFYFSLKDEDAQIKAVMFRNNASRVRFRVENGMRVIVRGRVSMYEAAGQYQIFVDDMQPDGVGALNLAFEQLKEKLQKEGLFDAAHKKPIPKMPKRVGVITSATGAAVQDILNILGRRFPLAEVVFAPVLVQGEGAHEQLIAAIQEFNRNKCADVLIIGRGGGSTEDLWEFNNEDLARAVYASKIPVISAVGHETDFTICDFVADLRAPTPSAAAELAVPEQSEVQSYLDSLQNRLLRAVSLKLSDERYRLSSLTEKGVFSTPALYFDNLRMRLMSTTNRFFSVQQKTMQEERLRLRENASKLQSLSPLSVLARGYSVTSTEGGAIVKSKMQLSVGADVEIRLADGSARCQVKEIL